MSNKPPPPTLPCYVPPGWTLLFRAAPLLVLQGSVWLLQSFRILWIFPLSLRMGTVSAGPQHPWFLCPLWPSLLLSEGPGRPPAASGWGRPPAHCCLPKPSPSTCCLALVRSQLPQPHCKKGQVLWEKKGISGVWKAQC